MSLEKLAYGLNNIALANSIRLSIRHICACYQRSHHAEGGAFEGDFFYSNLVIQSSGYVGAICGASILAYAPSNAARYLPLVFGVLAQTSIVASTFIFPYSGDEPAEVRDLPGGAYYAVLTALTASLIDCFVYEVGAGVSKF
ncbi:MAG: hypothetical protein K0R73_1166 [Candidatus Midichloriaceae bacterium]|jgi:hypothetical protein|nr:hypothetical protein [Candidatus Midichloriaceae bacterium]